MDEDYEYTAIDIRYKENWVVALWVNVSIPQKSTGQNTYTHTHPSFPPSIHPPIHPSIHPSIHLSIIIQATTYSLLTKPFHVIIRSGRSRGWQAGVVSTTLHPVSSGCQFLQIYRWNGKL